MASTKFYLDLRGKAKDGKGSVVIMLSHNYTANYISTGIRVSAENWNGQKVIKLPEASALNANLQEQKSKVDRSIALLSLEEDFESMTATQIKAELINETKRKNSKGHLVSELFYEYMNEGTLKQGTKDLYAYTLKKVLDFGGKNLRIEMINLKWLRAFDLYLSKTQKVNGKSIYLRNLRAVCNYARHIGIQFQYPFTSFSIKQEPTLKRSVDIEKFREFYSYPTSERNQVFRDYFFLMFFLIGINVKDLLLAKKSQIIDGRFEYIREKTGKKYSIKLEPEAIELIEKYKGKKYLLEALDHCLDYKNFTKEINKAIKEIGEEIVEAKPDMESLFKEMNRQKRIKAVIPGVTTYYARHTWATLAYEIGIPMDIISQALGHSFGNRTTLVYVKPDQHKVDEANRKVIDYFLQKSDIKVTNPL